jgi:hypothetical protein
VCVCVCVREREREREREYRVASCFFCLALLPPKDMLGSPHLLNLGPHSSRGGLRTDAAPLSVTGQRRAAPFLPWQPGYTVALLRPRLGQPLSVIPSSVRFPASGPAAPNGQPCPIFCCPSCEAGTQLLSSRSRVSSLGGPRTAATSDGALL